MSEQRGRMFPEQSENLEPMGGSTGMAFKNSGVGELCRRGSPSHFPQCSCLHALIRDVICDS